MPRAPFTLAKPLMMAEGEIIILCPKRRLPSLRHCSTHVKKTPITVLGCSSELFEKSICYPLKLIPLDMVQLTKSLSQELKKEANSKQCSSDGPPSQDGPHNFEPLIYDEDVTWAPTRLPPPTTSLTIVRTFETYDVRVGNAPGPHIHSGPLGGIKFEPGNLL
ncbi:hypothetical protein AVEN_221337-1 [Araneus ventricosus]|uniref:Uncharacterized protein n=1 Tax=Araneus ventricosus TaxID=182803 RepID=A0A4Y2AYF3_ARAVE|nr:hypothetical protein AVEN_221337-1 [Araneus ventricosus]